MFDVFLDYIKRLLKSRLFPVTIIYLALFVVIVHRLFVLQIVQGPEIVAENELKSTRSRVIKSTRGNLYDRKGKLLAYNVLTSSVVMEDSTKVKSNAQRNEIIHKMIRLIEQNGDTLDTEFYIRQNEEGGLEFTVEGSALTRFKKNVFSYVLKKDGTFPDEYPSETAEDAYEFLKKGTGDAYTRMFGISDEYNVEETLKIMSVRYALFINYPKYAQITVASSVSDRTVAAINESSAELPGIEIQQQTHRVYEDSLYLAHIMGYTGLISAEQLETMNAEEEYYDATDVVGKAGLEKKYEAILGGTKGSEKVSVNSSGKVVEILSRTEPVAGSDIYLTIDSELQKNVYHILEKKIAGILLEKIVPNLDYGSKGTSATDITIPIYEVYYALINNNIIRLDRLNAKDATELEQRTYEDYAAELNSVFSRLDDLLAMDNTVTNDKSGDMGEFLDYFYTVVSKNLFIADAVGKDDPELTSYKNNRTSLSKLLLYALSNNWVDLSKLGGDEFFTVEEYYGKLVGYIKDLLKADDNFNKKIYRKLVFSYKLSGSEICLLLFDQGVLEYNEGDVNRLKNGNKSAYDFIREKITSLEITPAMLALEPCSGSVVVTEVKTGNVLALVTYPSYDNNKFANKIDSAYYSQVYNDKTTPMNNRPVTEKLAPGSTFKMITAFAALEEGVTDPYTRIKDEGEFDKINPAAKCHIYPGSHGMVNIVDAIKVSCNYYFYEMGWRLSMSSSGKFDPQLGLSRLAKYAEYFGLNETSGIELAESMPEISTEDAVRSSIGQGSNVYTPVQMSRYITTLANRGTCFDLTLIEKTVSRDGKTQENKAVIDHQLTDFKQSTWDSVWQGMYSVVNEQGGSVYKLFKNLDMNIAGKTGTSQISKISPNNALFVSFAPYEDPEISITTVIPKGYTSSNAAEVSKEIYKLYFGLEEATEILDGEVTLPEGSGNVSE
ncbi:penicillin-binding protein 2 [Anaerotaenia torta]|uniref:penicillin-binding transpeptidase domain-containing protein n=1 Tax=Anaerotaenia torta TaxID=433293 RepID=UPI003D23F374